MKIKNFKVSGYKSLHDFKVNSMANINMIYGYNNSGKSNMVKLLELIFSKKNSTEGTKVDSGFEQISTPNTGNFWEGIIENQAFIFNTNSNTEEIHFEFLFEIAKNEISGVLSDNYKPFADIYFANHNNDSFPIEIKGEITKLNFNSSSIKLSSVLLNRKDLYSIDNLGDKIYLKYLEVKYSSSPIYKNRFSIYQSIMRIFNDCVLFLDNDRYFVSEFENEKTGQNFNSRTFKNWIYKMYLNPELFSTYNELVEFLKEFKVSIDPKNNSLKSCESNSPLSKLSLGFSKNADKEINIMFDKKGGRLPLNSFGTGIQQLVYLLARIFSSKSRIVLIEELELNLSPKYQIEILKHLKELIAKNKIDQIFFTTHSNYLIYRNDFSIFEISIDDSGNSTCTKVKSPKKSFFAPNLEK